MCIRIDNITYDDLEAILFDDDCDNGESLEEYEEEFEELFKEEEK